MSYKTQILRFILVGFVSTTINYIFFIFFYKISSNVYISASFGYFLGFLNSYIFSKNWVFKKYQKSNKSLFKFLLVHLFSLTLINILISLLSLIAIDYRFSWLLSMGLAVITNFLGSKYFAFK